MFLDELETAIHCRLRQSECGSQSPVPIVGNSMLMDIGANLIDPMFQGEYREKQRHPSDLSAVLVRAQCAGVGQIMVTAGNLEESREALKLCQEAREGWPELFFTVGVHPTRCGEFEANGALSADAYMAELLATARLGQKIMGSGQHGLCMAVGECGLDYDRLMFCPRDLQLKYFEMQLISLAGPLGLPLFLHCRTSEAAQDLVQLLNKHRNLLPTPPGVVHSFDGSVEDASRFIELGFYIGINGCSLKTAENLDVVRQLPLDSLLLETDAPWCGIKASHAGHAHVRSTWEEVKKPEKWEEGKCVKDRCEPCHLKQVLEVVAGCRSESPEAIASSVWENSRRLFF